ncbi:pre-piRNA 3'-exonuclease trimmer-like [Harmonia axyridis]|uniref:pre-piRNA 3'-exonuclease trimmer-like n=1 Tax=Harmonia axyridis TaxID=115357 RepID=UPI001E275996|nr:pre-piRNA 3'-exonuclease trimmer-like [Harmonia axyridis]
MSEIDSSTFKQNFEDIKSNIKAAKFIGIDLEFSALNPLSNYAPSLFDTPKQRYHKLKKNVENSIPLQIGLTAFKFDADANHYVGKAYTFYVKPALFSHVNRYFHFETSSIEFLAFHNFDFNKCFLKGIPYMSRIQEEDLRRKLKNNEIYETNMNFMGEIRSCLDNVSKIVNEWYETATIGDILLLDDFSSRYQTDIEFKFCFHKFIRRNFSDIWIFPHRILTLNRVDAKELNELNDENDFNEEIIDSLLGFGKVYKLLVSLKKPIIGHNALMDVLILLTNFEGNLPDKYDDFKKLSTKLFPIIFDTKHIYYNIQRKNPEEKRCNNTDLKSLYEFFSDGVGRHLTKMDSTSIQIEGDKELIGKYHNAGWDAFCAGYIFIRLAFSEMCQKHPSGKIFMPTEYLRGMSQYNNCLNVIRCSVNHINLNGEDPPSIRPPYYVIEPQGNKKLDFMELTSALSAFGSIEIKPMSWKNSKALIAVDNYSSAKSMIREFNKTKKFKVQEYSFIRHSPIVRAALWSGVTLSGMTLLLLMVTNR